MTSLQILFIYSVMDVATRVDIYPMDEQIADTSWMIV